MRPGGTGGPDAVRPLPAVRPGDPFPAQLWLLRHGQSTGNAAEHARHDPDAVHLGLDVPDAAVPLSELGHRQAAATGRAVAALPPQRRPQRLVVSPYLRAVQTARGVLEAAGLDLPVSSDERLRERDLGIFEGLTGHGILTRHPEEAERRHRLGKVWYRPPGGESWADVVGRVRSFVGDELARSGGERLLVVSHQAVVMAFRIVLEGLDAETAVRIDARSPQPNCSLTCYEAVAADGCRLVRYADAGALEAAGLV